MAHAGRAELMLRHGDAEIACAGARQAVHECREIPDPVGEADALRLMAEAHLELGALSEAQEPVARAVALARRHHNALVEAEALRVRAHLFARAGDRENARDDADGAIVLYTRLGAHAEYLKLRCWVREALN